MARLLQTEGSSDGHGRDGHAHSGHGAGPSFARRRRREGWLLVLPALVLILALSVYPAGLLALARFHHWDLQTPEHPFVGSTTSAPPCGRPGLGRAAEHRVHRRRRGRARVPARAGAGAALRSIHRQAVRAADLHAAGDDGADRGRADLADAVGQPVRRDQPASRLDLSATTSTSSGWRRRTPPSSR